MFFPALNCISDQDFSFEIHSASKTYRIPWPARVDKAQVCAKSDAALWVMVDCGSVNLRILNLAYCILPNKKHLPYAACEIQRHPPRNQRQATAYHVQRQTLSG